MTPMIILRVLSIQSLPMGVVQAKATGRLTMHFANVDYLPFDFSSFTDNLSLYLDQITKMTDQLRLTTQTENELIDKGSYKLALDPTKALAPSKKTRSCTSYCLCEITKCN